MDATAGPAVANSPLFREQFQLGKMRGGRRNPASRHAVMAINPIVYTEKIVRSFLKYHLARAAIPPALRR